MCRFHRRVRRWLAPDWAAEWRVASQPASRPARDPMRTRAHSPHTNMLTHLRPRTGYYLFVRLLTRQKLKNKTSRRARRRPQKQTPLIVARVSHSQSALPYQWHKSGLPPFSSLSSLTQSISSFSASPTRGLGARTLCGARPHSCAVNSSFTRYAKLSAWPTLGCRD